MPAPIVPYWEVIAVLAALLAIAVWLWWWLPKREVARLALKIRDARARADVEDNYRKTVGQALGGIAVLLGAGVAYLQFSQQQRASHDLLISNQVSKGFEQLGSEKVVVRLGGIYALEGVMNNSDQYYRSVLETLTAFVRNGSRATSLSPLPIDIQAALTVIGRRSGIGDLLDLSVTNLPQADLFRANLTYAILTYANLTHAILTRANLTYAILTYANLTDADLSGANLTDANLIYADLSGANLIGASLDGQKQLDEACGSYAKLPTGLTLKPCPPRSP
jgi:hypothetical protein